MPRPIVPELQRRSGQACDQCNYRKIKCRVPPAKKLADPLGIQCDGCEKASLHCTWQRVSLRRGPKFREDNLVLRRRQSPPVENLGTIPNTSFDNDQSLSSSPSLAMDQEQLSTTQGSHPRYHPSLTDLDPTASLRSEQRWNWTHTPPAGDIPTENGERRPEQTRQGTAPGYPTAPPYATEGSAASNMMWENMLTPANHFTDSTMPWDPIQPLPFPEQDHNSYQPESYSELSSEIVNSWLAAFQPQDTLVVPETSQPAPGESLRDFPDAIVPGRAEESVVLVAVEQQSDPVLMFTLPPFPETFDQMRQRLTTFFTALAGFIPMLHREEMMKAFEDHEQERSLNFRALLLGTFALVSAVGTGTGSIVPGGRPQDQEMPEQVKESYIRDAHRANSLVDSIGQTTIASIVSSLHLFMAWEWQREHDRSWDCLQQAITRAQTLKIDRLMSFPPDRGNEWKASRLRLYYLLTMLERSHALLRPPMLSHAQPLRLPGRPWSETRTLRDSLSSTALSSLQVGHVRCLDLVDDRVVRCFREGAMGVLCEDWNVEETASLQQDLSIQMDEALGGRFGVTKDRFDVMRRVNWVITIAWLRDVLFQISQRHSIVHSRSSHPALRPSFVLHNLRQALLNPCVTEYLSLITSQDPSGDTFGKLYDITMTAVSLLRSLKAHGTKTTNADNQHNMGGPERAETDGNDEDVDNPNLHKDLLGMVMRSMAILCGAVRNQSMLSRLVQAVATVC